MEAHHTEGPWKFYTQPQPNGCPIVGTHRGLMIAMLAHSVKEPLQAETALANARLIAAAPELLEALQAVLRSFPTDSDMRAAGWEQAEIDLACRDYEAARAAVAKATQ